MRAQPLDRGHCQRAPARLVADPGGLMSFHFTSRHYRRLWAGNAEAASHEFEPPHLEALDLLRSLVDQRDRGMEPIIV